MLLAKHPKETSTLSSITFEQQRLPLGDVFEV